MKQADPPTRTAPPPPGEGLEAGNSPEAVIALLLEAAERGPDLPPELVAPLRRLAEAAAGPGPEAPAVTRLLFQGLVEPLNDTFSLHSSRFYDRAFCEVLDACRRLPWGAGLDQFLTRRGLATAADLVRRKERIGEAAGRVWAPASPAPEKVLVLSRVTVGADVAVTSLALAWAADVFVGAEVVFLAPASAGALVAGHPAIRHRAVAYPRLGGLRERLSFGLEVARIVEEETSALPPSRMLVVDPDTRLTQLGLLPVGDERRYLWFPSRSFRRPGRERLGELAAAWLSELTDGGWQAESPAVWLAPGEWQRARRLRERLAAGGRRIVSVNFGVGGNLAKALGTGFEAELLARLAAPPNGEDRIVLVSRGLGEEESRRAREAVDAASAAGRLQAAHLPERTGPDVVLESGRLPDVVTWDGGLAPFLASLAASDLYVGYDSAGQHAAAALGTPTLTVFRKSAGDRHFRRWQPWGRGPVEVLPVEPGGEGEGLAAQAAEAAGRLLETPGKPRW